MIIKLLKLSIRSILRDRRRSLLTFLITFFSFVILGLYLGNIKAFEYMYKKGSTRGDYGHIQVLNEKSKPAGELLDSKTYDTMITVEQFKKVKNFISTNEYFEYITPRLDITGIVGTTKASKFFSGNTVEVKDAINLYSFLPIVRGEFVSSEGEIVIGSKIAEALGVDVGDEVLLMITSVRGSLEAMNAKIVGIYQLGSDYIDSLKMYALLSDMTNLIMTNAFSKILIILNNDEDEVMYKVQEQLNDFFQKEGLPLKAYTYYDTAVFLNQVISSMKGNFQVGLVILSIVIFFALMNTLYMSITDRVNEFSTMRTIGMSRSTVFSIIILEGLEIVLIAVSIGLSVLPLLCEGINNLNIKLPPLPGSNQEIPFYIFFDLKNTLYTGIVFLVIGFLGSILPAISVTKLEIVRGFERD